MVVFVVRFIYSKDATLAGTQMLMQKDNRLQDFSYVDHKGNTGTLHAIDSEYTILVFYNPVSEKSIKAIRSMSESTIIRAAKQNGVLEILTIYSRDYESIEGLPDESIPEEWINACDKKRQARQLYTLHPGNMTLFFLLDRNKTVLLKDPDYSELELWIRENTNETQM